MTRSFAPNKGQGRGVQFLRTLVGHQDRECIPWPYACDRHGYGQCGFNGKIWRAHRLMCFLDQGEPPTPEHQATHECGNGHLGCVNPAHLLWKTETGNKRDAIRHDTFPRNRYGQCGKFKPDQVREIRRLAPTSTQVALSLQFGISTSALRDIINLKSYKHIS